MPRGKKAVILVVGLFLAGLLTAVLFPTVIGAMTQADSTTTTQAVGETVTLQGDLNATVDSVTSGTSATYTVQTSGDSATTTVNVSSNETVTVGGTDVTISTSAATSTNATQTYEYPTTYGWGAAGSLWLILPVILILPVFLYFVAVGTGRL